MKEFCDSPSSTLWEKLSSPVREKMASYAEKIIQGVIIGNLRLARRIMKYYRKQDIQSSLDYASISLHRHQDMIPTLDKKTWRRLAQADLVGGKMHFHYDLIEPNTLVFRGSPKEIHLVANRPTYFALEPYNATTYLDYNLKGKKAKEHQGYLMIAYTIKPLRLFRLDDVENINGLLAFFFDHHDKTMYEILKQMFMSDSHTLIMKNHNLSRLKGFSYVRSSETSTRPVQFSRLVRRSTLKIDVQFANWLCHNGYQGYSAGRMTMHKQSIMEKVTPTFEAEMMLCNPTDSIRVLSTLRLKKPTSFEEAQNVLLRMQKDPTTRHFMQQHSYL